MGLPSLSGLIGKVMGGGEESTPEPSHTASFGLAGTALGGSGHAVHNTPTASIPIGASSAVEEGSGAMKTVVKYLSRISNQLTEELQIQRSHSVAEREAFLERKQGRSDNGSNSEGKSKMSKDGLLAGLGKAGFVASAVMGAGALIASHAKEIQKAMNDSPLHDIANNIKEGVMGAPERVSKRFGQIRQAASQAVDYVESIPGKISKEIGDIVSKYESGKKGYGAVSVGKGDPGGASYGKYQLSSKAGTLKEFLNKSGYSKQFAGMSAGTTQFNSKWKQLAAGDSNFGTSQHEFIAKTKYAPAIAHAAKIGFPVSDSRIQEMIWSGAIQHGGIKKILTMVSQVPNFKGMSVDAIIKRYYMIREQYAVHAVMTHGGSNQVNGIVNRYKNEQNDILRMSPTARSPQKLGVATAVSLAPHSSIPPHQQKGAAVTISLDGSKASIKAVKKMLPPKMQSHAPAGTNTHTVTHTMHGSKQSHNVKQQSMRPPVSSPSAPKGAHEYRAYMRTGHGG